MVKYYEVNIDFFDGKNSKKSFCQRIYHQNKNKKGVLSLVANTFMIIDGNSLAHRAYHAIPSLTTSQGIPTNAVYGFMTMLFKLIQQKKPDMLAVCFDKGKITFRNEQYSDYKGHRKPTPDDLRPQFPLLKEILIAMDIQILEQTGYEADDLIGSLATLAEKNGLHTMIVTGDRDALQLVSPLTTVLLTKKGITELDAYDPQKVQEKYGILPEQLIDHKGLTGDVSDNIPGVPGIGEKTASKLIKTYGSLEEVIVHRHDLTPKIKNALEQYQDQALLSKKLATIVRDIAMDETLEHYQWKDPAYNQVLPLLQKLEFKNLIKSILKLSTKQDKTAESSIDAPGTSTIETFTTSYITLETQAMLQNAEIELKKAKTISLALLGNRKDGLIAAALSTEETVYDLPLEKMPQEMLHLLQTICQDPHIQVLSHNAKDDLWLLQQHHITISHLAFDTMVASYLLNPTTPSRELSEIALEHLGLVLAPKTKESLPAHAKVLQQLYKPLQDKIKDNDMETLYYDIELPLVLVLADMEMTGVKVDTEQLQIMSLELGEKIEQLTQAIHQMAGEEFNIHSTKQLGHILFEKLQLPAVKRTKTGYSTDASVLEKLADSHEIVAKIVEHRMLSKLKSTYLDGLKPLIDGQTGLVHTTFHQDVTATGRLSSAEPNLQNIPIRLEEGRKIRKLFQPRHPENIMLCADYSQIELRILAHLSGDPVLTEAFQKNEDIHTRTASEVFHVPMNQVTPDMRGKAKAVNFGIIYGISDFGLAKNLKISRQEAKQYIEDYFRRYQGVQQYFQYTVAEARQKGYVTTLLHRKRYLPDLFSSNHTVRNFGERTAMNTPIQGSAADIIKVAMVQIYQEFLKQNLASKMILQVHDELIFDVPPDEFSHVKPLIQQGMENILLLKVPLVVDMKAGDNWYDTKPL